MSAWLALSLTPGLSPQTALAAAARLGGPERVLAAPRRLRVDAGIPERAARAVEAATMRAERERALIGALGGRVVEWSASEYPPALKTIGDAPLALMVAGDVDVPSRPAIAIVGARRASAEGRRLAEALARDLSDAGLVVVSGLAAGIDAAGHAGALDAAVPTVAVMATGLDDVYLVCSGFCGVAFLDCRAAAPRRTAWDDAAIRRSFAAGCWT